MLFCVQMWKKLRRNFWNEAPQYAGIPQGTVHYLLERAWGMGEKMEDLKFGKT